MAMLIGSAGKQESASTVSINTVERQLSEWDRRLNEATQSVLKSLSGRKFSTAAKNRKNILKHIHFGNIEYRLYSQIMDVIHGSMRKLDDKKDSLFFNAYLLNSGENTDANKIVFYLFKKTLSEKWAQPKANGLTSWATAILRGDDHLLIRMLNNPWHEITNVADFQGNTSLHFAAAKGNYQMVKYLLYKGCPASHCNENGISARDFAEHAQCDDVIKKRMIRVLRLHEENKEDSKSVKLKSIFTNEMREWESGLLTHRAKEDNRLEEDALVKYRMRESDRYYDNLIKNHQKNINARVAQQFVGAAFAASSMMGMGMGDAPAYGSAASLDFGNEYSSRYVSQFDYIAGGRVGDYRDLDIDPNPAARDSDIFYP